MLGLSNNLEVINALTHWLAPGRTSWLATVLQTYGSSPRPPGSMMALSQEGQLVGSISGGCIEEELLQRLAQDTPFTQPSLIHYGINSEDRQRLNLPCGGQLKVLIEPLTANHLAHFESAQQSLSQGIPVIREISMPDGTLNLLEDAQQPPPSYRHSCIYHTLGPQSKLLLTGSGQITQTLAQMASSLDYQVFVCDPRPPYARSWPKQRFPYVQFSSLLPDDFIRHQQVNPATAIIALSHDPRVDDMALMEALRTNAFYIGAMGSKKSSASRHKRLIDLDLTPAEINKLHAPVGLSIGSKTPAEIAVSILAHLTQIKNQRQGANNPIKDEYALQTSS